MEKYYTPELSELYEGFEYEILEESYKLISSIPPTKKWRRDSFSLDTNCIEGWCLNYLLEGEVVDPDRVRVKYLDKEDIQSLGWTLDEFIPRGEMDCKWYDDFHLKNIKLCFWGDIGKRWKDIDYIPFVDTIWCYKVLIILNEDMIFKGTLKNKSELKILMKQLNIQP